MNAIAPKIAVCAGLIAACWFSEAGFAASPTSVSALLAGTPVAQTSTPRPSQGLVPSLVSPYSQDRVAGEREPFARGDGKLEQMISDQKGQAAHFLREGRQALRDGKLTTAEYYGKRAAEVRASFAPNEDSPSRLLADVAQAKSGVTGAPQRLPAANPAPSYATALRPQEENSTAARYSNTRPAANAAAPIAAVPTEDGRALLRKARYALAAGDTRAAASLTKQAIATNQRFDFRDDSPQKVQSLVERQEAVQARLASGPATDSLRREQADLLLEQAQAMLQWHSDHDSAYRLAADADRLGVNYTRFQLSPRSLMERISAERNAQARGNVTLAGGTVDGRYGAQAVYNPADDASRNRVAGSEQSDGSSLRFANGGANGRAAANAVYNPNRDNSTNIPAANAGAGDRYAAQQPAPAELVPQEFAGGENTPAPIGRYATNKGEELMQLGEQALRTDQKKAIEYFREATKYQSQLDPASQQRLQNVLRLGPMTAQGGGQPELLQRVESETEALQRQVSGDVMRQYRLAKKKRDTDPRAALDMLVKSRQQIEASALSADDKQALTVRVDNYIAEFERYIASHRSQIELDETNAAVREDIQRSQKNAIAVQEKLAQLVDEYNRLLDERRLHEAELIAKKAYELAPEEPVAALMFRESKLRSAYYFNQDIQESKNAGVLAALGSVDESSIPFDDRNPIRFAENWEELTRTRRRFIEEHQRRRMPAEIEIEQKLKTPVSLNFKEAPLGEVIDHLKKVSGVNIHLDRQSLEQEGLFVSTPVSINLSQEIQLKSALNLILQPLHLSYVIKDEVLKITSEHVREGEVYTVTYPVADLVIPIPDFVPHSRMGLAGAIATGYEMTMRTGPGFQPPGIPIVGNNPTGAGMAANAGAPTPSNVIGQNISPSGFTTGGTGGAARADFDSLESLITTTVDPTTWAEVGGPGSVEAYEGNLSLVISQTQEVHEKITDLLDQLRRLQDLQVTIEVRFITLSDTFFERIGIDFDFNIQENLTAADLASGQSATVGLDEPTDVNPFPALTPNIQFRQGSFGGALPPAFAGFDPATAASFGVAILSDIEAFFLVQAAQGDSRSNIMQAPKVTLFNGQTASISDTSQTPFVTSVTPVVGDFAAAQAPIIVVLNEGTTLSVQAVVSSDRRFVRLTLVPFFSEITDVQEFTFTGRTDSTSSASEDFNDAGDTTSDSTSTQTFTEGTTIQLPTFAFTTVTTTVSVPDGGTVLLGGIKRLQEGRTELGVPFLAKVPYVSRLFKNVGIGRNSQSLMLMVTPRIIIQEEEEEKLGIAIP